jgi:hypothetical protein
VHGNRYDAVKALEFSAGSEPVEASCAGEFAPLPPGLVESGWRLALQADAPGRAVIRVDEWGPVEVNARAASIIADNKR